MKIFYILAVLFAIPSCNDSNGSKTNHSSEDTSKNKTPDDVQTTAATEICNFKDVELGNIIDAEKGL